MRRRPWHVVDPWRCLVAPHNVPAEFDELLRGRYRQLRRNEARGRRSIARTASGNTMSASPVGSGAGSSTATSGPLVVIRGGLVDNWISTKMSKKLCYHKLLAERGDRGLTCRRVTGILSDGERDAIKSAH